MRTHRDNLSLRDGKRGTHTSRTIMSAELGLLLDCLPRDADREDYRRAVIEEGKTSLLVEDDQCEGAAVSLVLIDEQGQVVARRATTVGGE